MPEVQQGFHLHKWEGPILPGIVDGTQPNCRAYPPLCHGHNPFESLGRSGGPIEKGKRHCLVVRRRFLLGSVVRF